MEDLDILWEDRLEEDFAHLIGRDWPRDMIIESAQNMLGDDWKKDGREILQKYYPELLGKFKKIADGTN